MAKKLLGFFNKQKQFEQDVMENGMQYSSFYGDSLRRLKKNKMAMFCACVLILLALMAIFAPLLAPYDPTYQDYSAVLGGPCKAHPFGTDGITGLKTEKREINPKNVPTGQIVLQ